MSEAVMTDDDSRLAVLEEQSKQASEQRHTLFKKLEDQQGDVKAIREDIHAIRSQLAGYRGFWAGVVFTGSCIAAVVGGLVALVWQKLFG